MRFCGGVSRLTTAPPLSLSGRNNAALQEFLLRRPAPACSSGPHSLVKYLKCLNFKGQFGESKSVVCSYGYNLCFVCVNLRYKSAAPQLILYSKCWQFFLHILATSLYIVTGFFFGREQSQWNPREVNLMEGSVKVSAEEKQLSPCVYTNRHESDHLF